MVENLNQKSTGEGAFFVLVSRLRYILAEEGLAPTSTSIVYTIDIYCQIYDFSILDSVPKSAIIL